VKVLIYKILLFLFVAAAFGALWMVVTTYLLGSKSGITFEVGFWLGRWTFTGWIFYLVMTAILYKVAAKWLF